MRIARQHVCTLGASVLLLGAGVAYAQPDLPAPVPAPAQPAETYKPALDAKPVVLVPVRSVIGASVRGTGDEKIGEVNELVISRLHSRAEFALVGHGGVLKIGEKVTAVPFAALGYDRAKEWFELPMTGDRLAGAPTMDPKEWATLSDPARTEAVYSYFETVRARPAELDPPDARPGNPPRLAATEHPVLRVSDLTGNPLVSSDGREIGKVDEIVVDAVSGRIALVVVTFGGIVGIGSERVPMPWPVFDINKSGRLYAVNIDKEQLTGAPRLSGKGMEELRQPDFASRVYRHFGRTASWLDQVAPAPRASSDKSPGLASYDRLCARGLPRTIDGTITGVEEASPMEGVPKIVILSLDTGPGEPTRVHLAPRAYLDQNGIVPKTGQKVSLRGRDAEIDGKRCIIATEFTATTGTTVGLRLSDGTSTWQWK